jgi:fructose-1,6-bisphosphatase
MTITEITVSAGRTFNHPYENYSNLKPMITVRASLEADDSWQDRVKQLQEQTEQLVEDHKQALLTEIKATHAIMQTRGEVTRLQRQIELAMERIEDLRKHGERFYAIGDKRENEEEYSEDEPEEEMHF